MFQRRQGFVLDRAGILRHRRAHGRLESKKIVKRASAGIINAPHASGSNLSADTRRYAPGGDTLPRVVAPSSREQVARLLISLLVDGQQSSLGLRMRFDCAVMGDVATATPRSARLRATRRQR